MLTPLTPMEFARRSRLLYGNRLAVIDGDLRYTYEQVFSRCDRWSHVLEVFSVRPKDRVAYITPNAHNHSGARVVCVHGNFLSVVDTIRAQCPQVTHWVALEGMQHGWHDYEALVAAATSDFTRAEIAETDLLTINYTSGTTARPNGVRSGTRMLPEPS